MFLIGNQRQKRIQQVHEEEQRPVQKEEQRPESWNPLHKPESWSDYAPKPAPTLEPRDDFIWDTTDEPHASRRREIMRAHPEVHLARTGFWNLNGFSTRVHISDGPSESHPKVKGLVLGCVDADFTI